MEKRIEEAVGVVLAAKKIEALLLSWAEKLTDDERYRVRDYFSRQSDQKALDIWCDALDIIDGRRAERG